MPRPTSTLFALLCTLTAGAGVAAAQTVIVTHAPAGGTVELVFNSARVQTATADAQGQATLAFAIPATESEADVRVSTESCGELRRVVLVERGLQASPATGPCVRHDLPDVFAVSRVTTFVVDMEDAAPSVHIRQGPVPPSWLGGAGESGGGVELPPAPKGAMVFAGVGFASSTDASSVACGTVSGCSSSDVKVTPSVGVGYWVTKNLGVQAAYVRPANFTALGSDTGFHFSSSRQTELLTLTGMAGVPVGGIRIYGRGGADYHRATLSTNETIDVSGAQSFELRTAGWGWVAAGGVEVWLKTFVGVYVDGGVAKLRGNAVGGAAGSLDDQLIFATVGLRLHIGR